MFWNREEIIPVIIQIISVIIPFFTGIIFDTSDLVQMCMLEVRGKVSSAWGNTYAVSSIPYAWPRRTAAVGATFTVFAHAPSAFALLAVRHAMNPYVKDEIGLVFHHNSLIYMEVKDVNGENRQLILHACAWGDCILHAHVYIPGCKGKWTLASWWYAICQLFN